MKNDEFEYAIKLARMSLDTRKQTCTVNRDWTAFGPLARDVIGMLQGESCVGTAANAWLCDIKRNAFSDASAST